MPVIIREATPDDAGALIRYITQLSEETDIDILLTPSEFTMTEEEERAFIKNTNALANSRFFVAELEGRIVGSLTLKGFQRQKIRHWAAFGMSVQRELRGQGIGKALLEHTLAWAKSTGILHRIELSVFIRNSIAIQLYKSCGFTIEGIRKDAILEDGKYLDDYIMVKLI